MLLVLVCFVILSSLVLSVKDISLWNFTLVDQDVYWNNQLKLLKYAVENSVLSLMCFWILNASKMLYRHEANCYSIWSNSCVNPNLVILQVLLYHVAVKGNQNKSRKMKKYFLGLSVRFQKWRLIHEILVSILNNTIWCATCQVW